MHGGLATPVGTEMQDEEVNSELCFPDNFATFLQNLCQNLHE